MSASLFAASFAILALALAGCVLGFVRLCSSSPGQRRVARVAGTAAVLSCLCMLAAAVTPPDRFLSMHVRFGLLAHAAAPAATLLFAWATARDTRFAPGMAVGWVALTLVPLVLIAVRYWGPGVATDRGLTLHVTVQKLAAIVFVILCTYETWAADRVVANIRTAVS